MGRVWATLLALAVAAIALASPVRVLALRQVSALMCLDACDENVTVSYALAAHHAPPGVLVHTPPVLHAQVKQPHAAVGAAVKSAPETLAGSGPAALDDLTSVVVDAYGVGPKGELQVLHGANATADVATHLRSMGFRAVAMVSCASLAPLRLLFADAQPFLTELLASARDRHFDGVHIAFEPEHAVSASPAVRAAAATGGFSPAAVTRDDGDRFLRFLVSLTEHAHAHAMSVSVTVASQQPLWWNMSQLLLTQIDKFVTVDTFEALNWESWQHAFVEAVNKIPLYRLAVGLSADNAGAHLSEAAWIQRFALIETFDVSGELELHFHSPLHVMQQHAEGVWSNVYHFMHDAVATAARARAHNETAVLLQQQQRTAAAGAGAGAGTGAAGHTTNSGHHKPHHQHHHHQHHHRHGHHHHTPRRAPGHGQRYDPNAEHHYTFDPDHPPANDRHLHPDAHQHEAGHVLHHHPLHSDRSDDYDDPTAGDWGDGDGGDDDAHANSDRDEDDDAHRDAEDDDEDDGRHRRGGDDDDDGDGDRDVTEPTAAEIAEGMRQQREQMAQHRRAHASHDHDEL